MDPSGNCASVPTGRATCGRRPRADHPRNAHEAEVPRPPAQTRRHAMNEDQPATPTSSGVPVTDDLIDDLAAEAEVGYDVNTLRRRGGRRPLGSAPAEVVPV